MNKILAAMTCLILVGLGGVQLSAKAQSLRGRGVTPYPNPGIYPPTPTRRVPSSSNPGIHRVIIDSGDRPDGRYHDYNRRGDRDYPDYRQRDGDYEYHPSRGEDIIIKIPIENSYPRMYRH